MMHKDLSNGARHRLADALECDLRDVILDLIDDGESIALAREHLINILPVTFDKAAEELEAQDGKEQA